MAFVLQTMGVVSQEFSLFNVVTDSFPTITANYFAIDEAGVPIDNLAARDFRVTETTLDGRVSDLSATVTHSCVTNSSSSSVSVVLIVDESNSMDNILPSGKRRLDYVKEALRAFVEKLPWNGETAVSIIGFSGRSRLLCDWQTTPGPVLAAIGRLTPQTATNYEVSFFGTPNVFDQMSLRTPSIPKVAFFLTDGAPNPDIARRADFERNVVAAMRAQGIRLYSATLMINRTDPSIAFICKATGGRSLIASEETLVDLAGVLAFEMTSRKVCKISWISPMVCSHGLRDRLATVQLRRGRNPDNKISYTTPDSSVFSIRSEPPAAVFGDVAPGLSATIDVVITAQNTDISVNQSTITTPAFFQLVNFVPFTLKRGQSKIISVRFTQGADRSIRQGTLTLNGTPACLPSVTLVGGGGTIILTSPNGGEVLSTCDTTTVRWTGVGADQLVRLEFSCDGTTWSTIADSVTGTSYPWLPATGCPTGRVRVVTVAGERLLWAQRLGGTGKESATGVAASPDGKRTYATGTFIGPTVIGATVANSVLGSSDGYLVEFDEEGTWVKTTVLRGDVGANERLHAVRVDGLGNVYVAGTSTSRNITFGNDQWTKGPIDEQVGVLYKLRPDGSIVWRHIIGGSDRDGADIDVVALDVRKNADGQPEVVLYGTVENIISIRSVSGSVLDERDLPNNGPWGYSITISPDGSPRISVSAEGIPGNPSVNPLVADDEAGYRYRTGSYEGRFTVPLQPPVTLDSRGQSDVWVARTSVGISTNDVSDRTFRVLQPLLLTQLQKITFDSTAIGRAAMFSSATALRNIGTAPVTIDSVVISGVHATDFRMVDSLSGMVVDTANAVSMEVMFTPSAIGTRTALLTIYGSCDNIISLPLTGEGRAPCPWDLRDSIDLGRHIVASTVVRTISCVLRSDRLAPLRGVISIKGSTDFQVTPTGVFTLRTGECLDVRVTYTPKTPGASIAQITFNLPTECGIAFTTLLGEGLLPEVGITDLDLGNHRLGTTASDSVYLSNNGEVDVTVEGMFLADTAGTGITANLPGVPFTLPKGSVRAIPVYFNPTVRGAVHARLTVDVKGVDTALVSNINAYGFQPTLEARGYSFAPVLVGTSSTENGFVRLYNRDADWPLHVDSVFLRSTADFSLVNTTALPLRIAPLDSADLPVSFSPSVTGVCTTPCIIVHDGIGGVVPPYTLSEVTVDGIGLQPSVLPPVVMDTILSCVTGTVAVQLTNDHPTLPLLVTGVVNTGDVGAFRASPSPPFTIPAGGVYNVTVEFTPTAPGRYAAAFAYTNTRGLDLTINASAVATSVPLQLLLPATTSASIGQQIPLPIAVAYSAGGTYTPSWIEINITYPSDALSFVALEEPSMPGWTFTATPVSLSNVLIRAQRNGSAPLTNGAFATPVFTTYLTRPVALDVVAGCTADGSCIMPIGATSTVDVSNVCFTESRLISFSKTPYSMGLPRPSPANTLVEIDVGLGLSTEACLEMFDATGRRVTTIHLPSASGTYNVQCDVSALPQGAYTVCITAGPYRAARPLFIVR